MSLSNVLTALSRAERLDPAGLTREQLPAAPGIYAWFKRGDATPAYVGKATGERGLRHRIWSQHLRAGYLETREDKWTAEDQPQVARGVTVRGQPAIEKSAFRKNLARAEGLEPGEGTVRVIKSSYELVVLPLEGHDRKEIGELEASVIRALRPALNRSGRR